MGFKGGWYVIVIEIKELYDLTFYHIIQSFEQDLMKNQHFLQMNPVDENNIENRPNYATTLKKYSFF